jgi:hypothetical protein
MKQPSNASMRVGALIGFLLLIAGLSGCGGGAQIMGRLDYTDAARPTAGDSVWVQLQGQEDIGATVTVKADNTWVYQPKSKTIRAWAGEYPPVKKANKNDDDPVLVIQALTPTHRTKVQYVNYVQLKKQEDKQVRLQYELLPSPDTTSHQIEREPDDPGIRP